MIDVSAQEPGDMMGVIVECKWVLEMSEDSTNEVPNCISLLLEMLSEFEH
jgi:hypothetical protein